MAPPRRGADGEAEVTAFKEGVLRQYVEHCQAHDGCPLTGSTDEAIAQLTTFVDGLDKNPLTAPDSNVTVNTQDATAIVQQYAVEKPDWEALTAMLTPAMNERDGTLMVKAKQSVPDLSPNTTVEEAVSSANSEVMFGAVICNDYPDTGGTASDWDAQAAAEKKSYPFFGGTSNAMEAYCRGWGHRAQTPPQETHAEGSDPILVVGLTKDSRTLYPWAQSLTDQLDNGHLLTVEGYGHVTFGSNACATAAMTDFLVNGTVPAEGTTCAAEPQPAAAAPRTARPLQASIVLLTPTTAPDRGLASQVVLLGDAGTVQLLELRVRDVHAQDIGGLVPVPVVAVGHVDAIVVRVGPLRVVVRRWVDGDGAVRGVLVVPRGVEPVLAVIGAFRCPWGVEGVSHRSGRSRGLRVLHCFPRHNLGVRLRSIV